jgi:hypothetical protein
MGSTIQLDLIERLMLTRMMRKMRKMRKRRKMMRVMTRRTRPIGWAEGALATTEAHRGRHL